jgi:hypothetical protein
MSPRKRGYGIIFRGGTPRRVWEEQAPESAVMLATDMCKTQEAICALLEFLEAEQ